MTPASRYLWCVYVTAGCFGSLYSSLSESIVWWEAKFPLRKVLDHFQKLSQTNKTMNSYKDTIYYRSYLQSILFS